MVEVPSLPALPALPALPQWLNDSIAMRPREQTALVHALLAPGVRTYVEWGSGGSTELVSWLMNSRLTSSEFRAYSIESSLGWMARMRERSRVIRVAEKKGRLRFLHGDIGVTGHLGYPVDFNPEREPARALPYVDLRRHLPEVGRVDLALVDGRFRVACLLEVLTRLTPRRGRALLHDFAPAERGFRARSARYAGALKFYNVVSHDETLLTLQPRLFVNETLRGLVSKDALSEAI